MRARSKAFALESVLSHRQRTEDSARREFSAAKAVADQGEAEIRAMYRRGDEVRVEIAQAERRGSARDVAEVSEMNAFLTNFARQIEAKKLAQRDLILIVENKREELIVAARETKVLEKLKERRSLEWREWIKQSEAKEMDDLTTMRRGKR